VKKQLSTQGLPTSTEDFVEDLPDKGEKKRRVEGGVWLSTPRRQEEKEAAEAVFLSGS